MLAFTFGTWRRVIDDAKYPDIAQDIGTIDLSNVPANAPRTVVAKSDSEDQAMAWSPNGEWIAFHSHREMSDDIWLRPADGSRPDQRITFLGRGAEVGWPRWSPDGKRVLLDGARKSDGRSVIYEIGVDQESGRLTTPMREVKAEGLDADITHAEWLNDTTIIGVAKEGPGWHAIFTLPSRGGRPATVTACVEVPVSPRSSVTVSVTVYVPSTAYAWDGFRSVEVDPSPNDQLQPAMVPS
jgi:dipeptidyl aminopeptidase/acylaminoacyl peptidase